MAEGGDEGRRSKSLQDSRTVATVIRREFCSSVANEATDEPADQGALKLQRYRFLLRKKARAKTDIDLGFQFTERASSDVEETERILVGATGVAFCDVGRD